MLLDNPGKRGTQGSADDLQTPYVSAVWTPLPGIAPLVYPRSGLIDASLLRAAKRNRVFEPNILFKFLLNGLNSRPTRPLY